MDKPRKITGPSGHQVSAEDFLSDKTLREIYEETYLEPDVAHATTPEWDEPDDVCCHCGSQFNVPTLEQRVTELEKKLYALHYQLCVHVTTEG